MLKDCNTIDYIAELIEAVRIDDLIVTMNNFRLDELNWKNDCNNSMVWLSGPGL